jgi:hypothetical protein
MVFSPSFRKGGGRRLRKYGVFFIRRDVSSSGDKERGNFNGKGQDDKGRLGWE